MAEEKTSRPDDMGTAPFIGNEGAGAGAYTVAGAGAHTVAGAGADAHTVAGAGAGARTVAGAGTDKRAGSGASGTPFIQARGLTLNSIIGTPYRDVTLTVPRDSFVIIDGEDCTGKTPLLLTLAGRMAPSKGTLTVGGYSSPKERNKIAHIAGLGLFRGVNDLDENLTCKAQLRAELELYGKPNRADDLQKYFATWHLEHIMEKRVRDLAHYDLIKLGIALGMANDPNLLVVDDVEEKLTYD